MKLEDLIKALADAGLGEEEIKQALAGLQEEIAQYIGGEDKECVACDEEKNDDAEMNRLFF